LYDNLEFLSKYKILSYNPEQLERTSKAAQFWCYLTACIIDIIEWRKAVKELREAERDKKLASLRLTVVKDFADLLRVAPPYLRRYFSFMPTHDGLSAIMGTIAGAVGAYQVWLKTK